LFKVTHVSFSISSKDANAEYEVGEVVGSILGLLDGLAEGEADGDLLGLLDGLAEEEADGEANLRLYQSMLLQLTVLVLLESEHLKDS
jgi:hypothetical protein